MYDLTKFTLSHMTACGAALRHLGADAGSMEEAAGRIVRHLYDSFTDPRSGERSLVLVRLFETIAYQDLGPDLQKVVQPAMERARSQPNMKCLTLLGTAGSKPEWNSRAESTGHQAIPLSGEKTIARFPMISQLIEQLDFHLGVLLQPDQDLLVDLEQKTYNVFHVSQARGSPHVPAQEDFVIPWGVRSVLGFGGMLPSGDLFATIIFSRTPIDRDTANMFKPLALSAKVALLPFVGGRIFT